MFFSNLFHLILAFSRLIDVNPLEDMKKKYKHFQKKTFQSHFLCEMIYTKLYPEHVEIEEAKREEEKKQEEAKKAEEKNQEEAKKAEEVKDAPKKTDADTAHADAPPGYKLLATVLPSEP